MAHKRDNMCKFCKKGFSSDKVLANHMCKNKKRYADRNSTGSRIGFNAFQRFYHLTTNSKKPKTIEDFIESKLYIGFVKFGRYLAENRPPNVEMFIDFVINNGIKMNKWTSPEVYDAFIVEWVRKEPVNKALERTILNISEWAEENDADISKFFSDVSTYKATHMIRWGKISPWVLYLASTSDQLLSRLNGEQFEMIQPIIDPKFWKKKISTNQDDVSYVDSIMEYSGL